MFTTVGEPVGPPLYCGVIFPFQANLHVIKLIRQSGDFSGDFKKFKHTWASQSKIIASVLPYFMKHTNKESSN